MLYSLYRIKKGPDYLAFFYVVLCLFLFTACSNDSLEAGRYFQISGPTMGTTYSIKGSLPVSGGLDSETLNQYVAEALDDFNRVMSTYLASSELSKVNKAPQGEWLPISSHLEKVIQMSGDVYEKSGGVFDVTLGPLVNLWGFGPDDVQALPTQEQLDMVGKRIGFEKLELADGKIKKTADVYIDLSAVAKGYATDVVAALLESKGVANYMVEIGGELKLKGVNQHQKVWTIGVEKPALGREGAVVGVSGDNIAIATSGEYRNYYERDGMRVSHTIDPTTRRPITHNLASVTVVAETGGYADAWATAINVLGAEKGLMLSEHMNLAAFFIIKTDDGFEVKHSSAFSKYKVDL